MDGESTENRLNGDGDKQVLAPADGPRENLISTAVKFLQNPKVVSSPLYQKKAFLEKKGLTQEEINIAIQRSGMTETQVVPAGYQPHLGGSVPLVPPGYYAPIPPRSRWAKARDLTMTTVIVAGVSYAVYQLIQKYLRPLVWGKTVEQTRLELLEGQIRKMEKSVVDSLTEINKTLSGIQAAVNNNQSQVMIGHGEIKGIADLKCDIASLKGLLLNRNQFPPAPSTSPVLLPSWQRSQPPAPTPSSPVTGAAPAVTGSQSYADVVRTSTASQLDERSMVTTQESDSCISDILEQSPATESHSKPHPTKPQMLGGLQDHSESQDLSYSRMTDSDSTSLEV